MAPPVHRCFRRFGSLEKLAPAQLMAAVSPHDVRGTSPQPTDLENVGMAQIWKCKAQDKRDKSRMRRRQAQLAEAAAFVFQRATDAKYYAPSEEQQHVSQ